MNKALLIILDGFGEGRDYAGNAITKAKTPALTALRKNNFCGLLKACGEAVGLPEGNQGGSEVGHFTIGAGRVVFQSLEEINKSIADKSFFKIKPLKSACDNANASPSAAMHLVGMISDAGVHSNINHLFALLDMAKSNKVQRVFIHAITDGRDVHEKSASKYIDQIERKIHSLGMSEKWKIASIIGRYYAMDRDNNWGRIEKAYDLYTLGKGTSEKSANSAIANAYKNGTDTDYYIEPILLDKEGLIKDSDSVVFWNFRTDRSRQLTWAFTGESNAEKGHSVGFKEKKTVRPFCVCIGPFSEKAPVCFPTPIVKNNLGEVISANGLKQLRLAETQKFAHVTYFLNSQCEIPFKGEERIMIESKRCKTYAEIPEMSANEITSALIENLDKNYALIVCNFANPDLVGHSGDLKATIKAVETVDECVGKIIPAAKEAGYTTIITGDHGNAEEMLYPNGEPCPSHTTNPVPCFIVEKVKGERLKVKKGGLADIAPTILKILDIKKPKEMTGDSLI